MTSALEKVVNILDVEKRSENLFAGKSYDVEFKRIFGGQVIAQSLVSAQRTIEDTRDIHSFHCYFLRPGDPKVDVLYKVDRIRDGRSFATRQVTGLQNDKPIFSFLASFQKNENGFEHQIEMGDIAPPEELPSVTELADKYSDLLPALNFWKKERPVTFRFVDFSHYISKESMPPKQSIWFKINGQLQDDKQLHEAILAYSTDFNLVGTALLPHGKTFFDPDVMVASLDHSMWFHRPFNINEWFLYQMDSPSSSKARGLCRGNIFDRDGRLVASTTQEGLIRPID